MVYSQRHDIPPPPPLKYTSRFIFTNWFNFLALLLFTRVCLQLFISPQEPHKRSQLWRLTGEGLLRHEGSSPPSVKPSSANAGLVLDIDSLAPPTCGKYVRLVLSKHNLRRMHSQTWSFTEVNRNMILLALALLPEYHHYVPAPCKRVSGKGHKLLAKPVVILKVRCAWRWASRTLFFRPPWMHLLSETVTSRNHQACN